MTTKIDIAPRSDRELVLARIIDAPREQVYRAWTDPELMKQWFTPKPWTTEEVKIDVRPGGRSEIVMADENGNRYPNPGQYVEVVPNEKLVFTDAFVGDWVPSERPFMTAQLTFEDAGNGQTRYIARVMHHTVEALQQHEAMGFHDGWGTTAEQLEQALKAL